MKIVDKRLGKTLIAVVVLFLTFACKAEKIPSFLAPTNFTNKKNIFVKLKSPSTREIGDYNIIKNSYERSRAQRMLVTIEPIKDSRQVIPEISVSNFTPLDILSERAIKIKKPVVKKATVLGVYICSDDAAVGSCRDKEIRDLSELSVSLNKAGHPPAVNTILYFGFIIATPTEMFMLKRDIEPADYTALKMFLEQKGISESEVLIDLIKRLVEKTNSYTPISSENLITLQLPHFNAR